MEIEYFTKNPEVQQIIKELKTKNLIISDVLDEEGNQYVDLVQEGGGVHGIALLGYTYVLEQVGIRFFSLAGTSAGAINTMLLASVADIQKPKTEEIIDFMTKQDLFDFVDGPFRTKQLFNSIKKNAESKFKLFWTALIVFWGLTIIPHILKYKGLNPGEEFRKWIFEILKKSNIHSTSDLLALRQKPKGLSIRKGIARTIDGLEPKLKIIAAEITTETRVIFPDMNKLFWNEPDKVNPADYVRASMSIPLFFHPFKVKTGNRNKEDWYECVKYKGEPPEESVFVDGGVLSNFPIDVFHNHKIVPRLPTFGVKLGDDRHEVSLVNNVPKFLMAIFNSARHVLDYQFLLTNPDYEKLITKIDVGEHNWLNFSMPDKDKLDLFKRGAKAAAEFLTGFKWEKYKTIREELTKPDLPE
ncbi:MAG: patatin-like phospholipase family protein [Ignavibacteria bacterium]|nr:patatin-like phospholipase family protein [Ignavibacteria bacterium]